MLGKKFGYARVSTKDQKLDLQVNALKKFGCDAIYSEKVSGYKDRPILNEMIGKLRSEGFLICEPENADSEDEKAKLRAMLYKSRLGSRRKKTSK